jgi:hypothetical protein
MRWFDRVAVARECGGERESTYTTSTCIPRMQLVAFIAHIAGNE